MVAPAPTPRPLRRTLKTARLATLILAAAGLATIATAEVSTGEVRNMTGYAGAAIAATGITASAVCHLLTTERTKA